MDFDLISDFLTDPEPPRGATSNLLSNLPDRLTSDEAHTSEQNIQRQLLPTPLLQGANITRNSPGAVITKIEDIFESITDCILDEKKELTIVLKTRPNKRHRDGSSSGEARKPGYETRSVTFPNRNPKEAWKFTALLRILELSHEALVTETVTTKRDIYYRDPDLFVKQAVVDRYVEDIAYTLGVERDALNVVYTLFSEDMNCSSEIHKVAAAKGLVAGSFGMTRKDNTEVDFSNEPEGTLIPNSKEIQGVEPQDIQWILVIEKEATFRTLGANQYWKDSRAGKGIIITAKGYPDIQTRQFLHLLWARYPHIPIFALVDFDPDGLSIMSTYKHGSTALAHESLALAVPSVQWLGVRSSDFIAGADHAQGLLKLSGRDRRVARKMLERDTFAEEGNETEWRRELQVMLMVNIKVEIQILGNGEKLGEWLDEKLAEGIGSG